MSSLTAEQADWIQDAIGIVQVVRREEWPPDDIEAMQADIDALVEHYNREGLGGIIGILAYIVSQLADDEYLEETVHNAIVGRP